MLCLYDLDKHVCKQNRFACGKYYRGNALKIEDSRSTVNSFILRFGRRSGILSFLMIYGKKNTCSFSN